MSNIESEIKQTGEALMSALEQKMSEINASPLNDTQKKELIAMAEGIKQSIATQDLEVINKILKFA